MKLTGAKELQRKLNTLSEEVRGQKLETAARAGAMLIENDAKRRAPYRTGTLRRSIHSEVSERTADSVSLAIGTNVEYAARIEFGFSGVDELGRRYNQPPMPYLRPAMDENIGRARREVVQAWKDVMRGVTI